MHDQRLSLRELVERPLGTEAPPAAVSDTAVRQNRFIVHRRSIDVDGPYRQALTQPESAQGVSAGDCGGEAVGGGVDQPHCLRFVFKYDQADDRPKDSVCLKAIVLVTSSLML